jgi:hypothetical protein
MKQLLFIFGLAAVISHALVSMVTGSLNPGDWSPLLRWGCILFVAPCVALAIAVLEGTFESRPPPYSPRALGRRRGR